MSPSDLSNMAKANPCNREEPKQFCCNCSTATISDFDFAPRKLLSCYPSPPLQSRPLFMNPSYCLTWLSTASMARSCLCGRGALLRGHWKSFSRAMEIFIGNNEALVLVSHLRSGTLLVVSYTTLHVGGGWLGQVRPVGRQNHPLSQIAKNPALVPDERTHQHRGVVWRLSKPFF